MRIVSLASAVLACALSARGAQADDVTFRSPTGNINCLYLDLESAPEMRCDISQFTPSFKVAPPGTSNEAIVCTPALMHGYSVTPTASVGQAFCPTDGVNDPGSTVLPYGASLKRGGMTCVSETSGMTCRNAKGHGFSISRAQQKVF